MIYFLYFVWPLNLVTETFDEIQSTHNCCQLNAYTVKLFLVIGFNQLTMNIHSLSDICGGFRVQLAAMKTTFLLLIVILLNVNADVQQPPVPPTATRPTVDKFMKREHSLMKPFQGIVQNISINLHWQKLITTFDTFRIAMPY